MKKIFKKKLCFSLSLCMAVSMMSLAINADSLENEISFTENAAGFIVTQASPKTGDYYQLWMSKQGGTGEQLASISNESDFNRLVSYADFQMAYNDRTPVVFTVDLSSTENYGVYGIRIIRTAAGGAWDEAFYSIKYVDPTLSIRAVEDFMTVSDDTTFKKLVEKYTEEEFFSPQQLGILSDADIAGTIGSRFAMVRDMVYDNGEVFPSANSIVECAGAAYAVEQFLGSDVQKAAESVAQYGSFLSEYLPDEQSTETYMEILSCAEDYLSDAKALKTALELSRNFCSHENTEKILAVHRELRQYINDLNSAEDVILWAEALSGLSGANRAEIEDVITQNAELFGIDLSPNAHYGMSLAQVARYFSTDNLSALYGTERFGNYYDAMAKKAAEEAANEPKSKGSSGGSAKSKGQNFSSDIMPIPDNTVQTDETRDSEEKPPFRDLDTVPWAQGYIESLYQKGIVDGVSEESFDPNRAVTREEFVKMLVLAFDISEDKAMNFEFADVVQDMWSYPYIKKAFMGGIISGMDKNQFGAKEYVTRQDVAVMLSKAMGLQDNAETEAEALPYADSDEIADYAKSAVTVVVEHGIMKGMNEQKFAPREVTTRAQAATLIGRALEQTGGEQS